MNTTKTTIGLLSAAVLFFASCKKDNPSTPVTPKPVTPSVSKKVYVINEGGFNSNNASISLYDPSTGNITEDYYKAQNGSNVGDIAQSMNYINGKFYIVINNSSKILVCDTALKKTAEISGLNKPRYILKINNDKAYVSDGGSKIGVVNLNDNTKTYEIELGSTSEQMVLTNNKVFVTTFNYPSTEYIYIIDVTNNTKTDSVNVGTNATNIVLDKNNKVWVLGNKLSRINPETNTVELSLEVSNNPYFSSRLCLNKTKDTLFYLNTNIYKMSINDTALPTSAIVNAGTKNFYGMGINPNDYTIYTTDALDYIQKANVYIYKSNGTELKNFKAGIIANGFYFE